MREAKRIHPDAWWWVKAYGCDITGGLKESMKNEWSGDVDLNDGTVHKLHHEYVKSLSFLAAVGVKARRTPKVLMSDLNHLQADLETHLTYLSFSKKINCIFSIVSKFFVGLAKFFSEYSLKVAKGTSTTNSFHQLAWDADEIG